MRLVRFRLGDSVRPGTPEGDEIVDLSPVAHTMEALIARGRSIVSAIQEQLADLPRQSLRDVELLAPVEPASLRDFLAFEDHAKAGAARRGEELNPAWYEMPVYYKGNHRSILGPDEPLVWPTWTEKLDFELELACIVGARGHDLTEQEAERAIFGYTIMNDWSARDVQRAEMAMRLGPAKSKDFATSLGPCIVTADEFSPASGLAMRARVNGETWFETTGARMHWTFAQMIAYVSRSEDVYPRDVYGSGTAYGGCGLDQDRWLPRGATVELEIDGIGTLRTELVDP
ncbi:MAG TPA: fumarylacetoacetate hydrolase family protein [Actinomycetota bacterium]|nr:fumarylacetoacetate hydrolase family protein [Actinomycetota bacterium]